MHTRILGIVFILSAVPALLASPVIVNNSVPPAGLGTTYNVQLTATQSPGPYTWSVPPGTLPPGLQLGAATGNINGIPTQAGSYAFTVTVTDQPTNQTGSTTFNITVMQITNPSPLPNATAGTPYSAQFQVSFAPPGAIAWMISSIPPGMNFDAAQGILNGTPSTPNNYSFAVTAIATQFSGVQTTKNFALTVAPGEGPAPSITTTSLANGAVGSNYSQMLAVSGGTPPYSTYTLVAGGGTPPPGINLDPTTGTLAGNPTATGTYTFSATVKDSANVTSAPKQLSITVQPRLVITNPTPLPAGTVGTFYSQTFQTTGGTPGYSYQAVQTDPFGSSVLPPGLTLTPAGSLNGTPTTNGTYNFGVIVTDNAGATSGATYSLTIGTAPTITTPSPLPPAAAGFGYQQTISATGGTGPYTFIFVGQGPAGFTLSPSGLLSGTPVNAGTLQFSIQVTDSANASATKAFQLPVSAAPPLVVSPLALKFNAPSNGDAPTPQEISVVSGNGSPVMFTATVVSLSAGPPPVWLKITPANGTTPALILVSVDQSKVTSGTLSAIVRIAPANSGIAPIDVAVSFTTQILPAVLDVSPDLVQFTARPQSEGPFDQAFVLRNAGSGTLGFTVTFDPAPWVVSVTPAIGLVGPNAPAVVRLRVNGQGLKPGGYRTVLHFKTPSGLVRDVPVTLFQSPGGAMLGLDVVGAHFDSRVGAPLGLVQNINVLDVGDTGSSLTWFAEQVTGSNWLTLGTLRGLSTPATPSVLPLSISAAGSQMPPGSYYSLIRITDNQAPDAPQYITVVLNQQPANAAIGPALAPAGLTFVIGEATGTTKTFQVYSTTPQAPYQVGAQTFDGANWISVNATAGVASPAAPGQVKVTVNPAGMPVGVYKGLVTVTLGGMVRSEDITMLVLPPLSPVAGMAPSPAAACAPAKMAITGTMLPGNFQVPAKWPHPLVMQVNDDCGGLVSGASVTANFSTGDSSLPLTSNSSQPGVYSATWQPISDASEMTVTVQATSGTLPMATAQFTGTVTPNTAPVLPRNGTVNAFFRQALGPLAPGLVVEIYGSDMAGVTKVPGVVPLPTLIQGTAVFLGRNQAPLYFVSPGQLDVEVPAELNQPAQATVVVSANGALTVPVTVTLNPLSPGIAAFHPDEHIIAQHADFSLIDAAHPAKPNEIILMYLVGLGETSPKVASGQPAPGVEPLARVTEVPTVTVDGATAKLFFFGQTPGAVGLYQINFQVPSNAKTGDLNVIVMQGTATANVVKLPVAP
ncbi:MAG: putative Ig domain-containing protein [Acidobacteriota bacterium]|nr:putative Ig domain-containing protein [Acidobacteriota bacterium]